MGRNQRDEEHIPATGVTVSNGTGHSLVMLAPAAVTISTSAGWLKVNDVGTTYYVPIWT